MKDWLIGDWGVKLGSLLLASGLWLHAVTENSYRRELEIPLILDDPVSEGDDGLVLASETPTVARITVFANGKDLLRLDAKDFILRLHPGGEGARRLTLRPTPADVEHHTDLNLVVETVLAPREVEITLDNLATRRVPLTVAAQLRVADSYTIVGPIRLIPDSVTVSGPRRLVSAVRSVATDSLRLDQLTAPVELEVALRPPRSSLLRFDRVTTRLLADIQELAEYEVANVPVGVRGRSGVRVAPSRVTVRVRGGADLIGDLDPERDLDLFVDVRGLSGDTLAKVPVRSPSGRLYELLEITPARVDVIAR